MLSKYIFKTFIFLFIAIISIYNSNFANATKPDDTWRLIDRSNSNHFKILKGTPFKFSFYNKLYNYYRITDDWALVFWISPDNNSLSEWVYIDDKNYWILRVLPTETVNVEFTASKTKVLLPPNKDYVNINWQYKVSDWLDYVDVREWVVIELNGGEEIITNSWLYWLTVDDETKLEAFNDNVDYSDTWINNYVMITPWFINLDMSDEDDLWHWVYEKAFHDTKWVRYALSYMWYWYVEWTKQEVSYWVMIYNSSYYNNIRFFYWEIDPSISTVVFAWMSNGNGVDKFHIDYSGQRLWDLWLRSDVLVDGSKIFEELVFPIWYEPDAADINDDLILDYQERTNTAPYTYLDKPLSRYAMKFNVKVNTDRVVCQREHVKSDWWDTLRWWKKDSSRVDMDDIDTFCFSAETPWIVVLDNATYAKGWYKVWQSKCVVSHLSLMWFNAQAIGWNVNTSNNCWLTYKIQNITKDLTIEKDWPHAILAEFEKDIDVRPVDTSKVLNTQNMSFNNPRNIKIKKEDNSIVDLSLYNSDIKIKWIKMISDKFSFLYWNSNTDAYIFYSNNRWEHFNLVKKVEGKKINFWVFLDNIIILFFEDWTYMRNIENGLWEWKSLSIPDYTYINDFKFISNRSGILVWNNWRIWKTASAWNDFEMINLYKILDLHRDEHLQSIDLYGSQDIWISTNRWNILYSSNAWETFYKKTTGSTIEYNLNSFEDWINVFKSNINSAKLSSNINDIDDDSSKSVKFNNWYQYLDSCIGWSDKDNYYSSTLNTTNLEPFKVNEYDKFYPKWKLTVEYFIDSNESIKGLDTLTLKDIYWNYIKLNVSDILNENNIEQVLGWNKVSVLIDDIEWDNYEIVAPSDTSSSVEHFQSITEYILNDTHETLLDNERIWIWKIYFAPISNISNEILVNNFNADISNTSNQTCKVNSSKDMLTLIDWTYDFSSFVNTDWTIKGYLTLDIYVNKKENFDIQKISLWNDFPRSITWNNIDKFSTFWQWIIKDGWNTFILPFNETGNINVTYNWKSDINWNYISYLTISAKELNTNTYNSYALDNIRYSSVSTTNLKDIFFFNKKEWLSFDDSNKYITDDNNEWWWVKWFNRTASSESSFEKFVKIRWREIYWIWNDDKWWFSYYSLDKGNNFKVYYSDSWIIMKAFDMIDYDDWLAVSENGILYDFIMIDE